MIQENRPSYILCLYICQGLVVGWSRVLFDEGWVKWVCGGGQLGLGGVGCDELCDGLIESLKDLCGRMLCGS